MVNKYPHLTKAPIIEAVIAVNFSNFRKRDEKIFSEFIEQIANNYNAEKEQVFSQEFFINVKGKSAQLNKKDIPEGYRLKLADGKHIIQLIGDTMSLSRLQPYADGEDFISEYKKIWEMYVGTFAPQKVERISMRYINKFSLPIEKTQEFLCILPTINLSNLFLRDFSSAYNSYSPEHEATSIIHYNMSPAIKELGPMINVMFDIDVYKESPFPSLNYTVVSQGLYKLKDLKNMIFFGNLTKEGIDYFR